MNDKTKFEEITSSLISRRAFLKKSFSIGSLALMSTTLGSIAAYSSQSFFNFTKVNFFFWLFYKRMFLITFLIFN